MKISAQNFIRKCVNGNLFLFWNHCEKTRANPKKSLICNEHPPGRLSRWWYLLPWSSLQWSHVGKPHLSLDTQDLEPSPLSLLSWSFDVQLIITSSMFVSRTLRDLYTRAWLDKSNRSGISLQCHQLCHHFQFPSLIFEGCDIAWNEFLTNLTYLPLLSSCRHCGNHIDCRPA